VQKPRPMKTQSSHGFTIIEALVAVAILSIGILATAKMQDQSIRGNFVSKRINTSVFFAAGEIERRAGLSYANATDSDADGVGGLFDIGAAADDALIYVQNGHTFNLFINVAENEPVDKVKTINVIVTHNNNRVAEFPYILRRD